MWCGPCQLSAESEADLVADIDSQIGAENWVLVDVVFENSAGQPSNQTNANQWRAGTDTPLGPSTRPAARRRLLYQYVLGLELEDIPTYFVVDPDRTRGRHPCRLRG